MPSLEGPPWQAAWARSGEGSSLPLSRKACEREQSLRVFTQQPRSFLPTDLLEVSRPVKGEAEHLEQGQEPMLGALGLPPSMFQGRGCLLQAVGSTPHPEQASENRKLA